MGLWASFLCLTLIKHLKKRNIFFRELCEKLQLSELPEDQKFKSNEDR